MEGSPLHFPVELTDDAVDYRATPDYGCPRIVEDEVDRHDSDPGHGPDRSDGS